MIINQITEEGETRQASQLRDAQRERLLMGWIIEFRFTTRKIACELLGMRQSNGYRFIARLVDLGLIEPIQAVLGDDLLILSMKGLKTAVSRSYVEPGTTRTTAAKIRGSVSVLHDLSVQRCVLQRLKQHRQIISVTAAGKLGKSKGSLRPDVLIEYAAEAGQLPMIEAIEFERTAKSRARIYALLGEYERAFKRGLCSWVIFVFDDDDKRAWNLYDSVFAESEWQSFKKNKAGQLKKTGFGYRPDPEIRRMMWRFTIGGLYQVSMLGLPDDPYRPADRPEESEEDEEEGGWDESNEPERRAAAPPVTVQIDAEPVAEEPTEGADQASADQPTSTGWRSFFRR